MKAKSLILAVFVCAIANAQNIDSVLNPVTVTASLQEMPASKTGRNIISISGAYFSRLPIHSIDDLLKYLPGVELQQRGPAGAQADIVIRGGTFQQVLVLLDGLRLNDPNTGHFSAYIPISPAEIERVEILKGAASGIYGSEAVGGVVQVITKTFTAKRNIAQQQVQIQANVGQYGMLGANAGAIYQKGNTAISGGILFNQANGQPQRGTYGFYNNKTASFSINQFLNQYWRLSFRTAYDLRDFSAQNFYTSFKSDTAKEKVTGYWNQLGLTYQKNKDQLQIDAGYKQTSDVFAFNSGSAPNENLSKLLQFAARYQHSFSSNTQLITGLQVQQKSILSNDRGNHQLIQSGLFLLLNQQLTEQLLVSGSIRLDHTQNIGAELVPQVNFSYKTGIVQWRGSLGKTIRQADFTERYNNYNKTLVTSGSIGNPDLKAETSFSYEFGVEVIVNSHWRISNTLFQRNQSGVIDWTPTPYHQMPRKSNLVATGSYALTSNIAKVNVTGWETDLKYLNQWSKGKRIMATAGLVWLDSKTFDAAPSFYLSSHAKLLVNSSLLYKTKYWQLSSNAIYKIRNAASSSAIAAELADNYFLLNAKFQVFLHQQKLACYLQADNLFNTSYSDLLGAVMPERWISIGIQLNL
ncbi:MAG: TonB-dependent receptor [Bacteroidetes bacterium 24-39-8]|nr:MAG: TonB-dependent receptor [Sphingobacteriia bacterium 35-40-8]OYZ50466.1 MAG: TonB-dependent receptor [Bacteroidetes bacterium 24-39-8]OZA68472.1 MAG: TonB-dependent receptor [Sphingobacteriia bacterium 39-39-8]HQR92369.1 TonB-dependent receptor [Sediminibacterium sp.]HQS56669.1 TonB-dependent receptor [Sediminibacterium sp.]